MTSRSRVLDLRPPMRQPARLALAALLVVAFVGAGMAASAPTSLAGVAGLPSCKTADTMTAQRTLTAWSRSVLDTRFRLTSTYIPKDLRSTASAGLNGGEKVRAFVIADLRAMASAARRAGARFSVQSGYRSYATQRYTFAHWVRVQGYARALRESARAGHSEHQLGTTLDLRSTGHGAPWDYADWGTSKAGKWLRANAWKFGFVMSYPKGKSAVTCYIYEPWHFRYVGRGAAAKVHASGLTLREYLWKQQIAPTPTPTPTPEPTPEPTPTATPTPEPTPTEQATPTPAATPTPEG